jgi:predicted O-linked N-acetylglucosamine transferase (SPINDLY family)
MPELITSHLDDYEKAVIYYATHQQERLAMREKLKAKRYTAPLFNVQLTVKHIESAYQQIWQRYCNGLPPANIRVIETNQVKPVTWRDIALF